MNTYSDNKNTKKSKDRWIEHVLSAKQKSEKPSDEFYMKILDKIESKQKEKKEQQIWLPVLRLATAAVLIMTLVNTIGYYLLISDSTTETASETIWEFYNANDDSSMNYYTLEITQ